MLRNIPSQSKERSEYISAGLDPQSCKIHKNSLSRIAMPKNWDMPPQKMQKDHQHF